MPSAVVDSAGPTSMSSRSSDADTDSLTAGQDTITTTTPLRPYRHNGDSFLTPMTGSQLMSPETPSASITLQRTAETLEGLQQQLAELSDSHLAESEPDMLFRCCCGATSGCPSTTSRERTEAKLKLCGEIGQALLQRYEAVEQKYRRAEHQLELKRKALSDSLRHVAQLERVNNTHLAKYADLSRTHGALEKRYTTAMHNQTLTQQSLVHVRSELARLRSATNEKSTAAVVGASFEERMLDAERRFEDARDLHQSEARKLREQLKWRQLAENRIDNLEHQLTAAGREVEDLKAQRERDAQDILSNAKSQLETLHSELSESFKTESPSDTPEFQRTLEDLVATNALLKHNTSELQRRLSQSLGENRQLRGELDELRNSPPPPRSRPLSVELSHSMIRKHTRTGSNPVVGNERPNGHARVASVILPRTPWESHRRRSSIAPSFASSSTNDGPRSVTSPTPGDSTISEYGTALTRADSPYSIASATTASPDDRRSSNRWKRATISGGAPSRSGVLPYTFNGVPKSKPSAQGKINPPARTARSVIDRRSLQMRPFGVEEPISEWSQGGEADQRHDVGGNHSGSDDAESCSPSEASRKRQSVLLPLMTSPLSTYPSLIDTGMAPTPVSHEPSPESDAGSERRVKRRVLLLLTRDSGIQTGAPDVDVEKEREGDDGSSFTSTGDAPYAGRWWDNPLLAGTKEPDVTVEYSSTDARTQSNDTNNNIQTVPEEDATEATETSMSVHEVSEVLDGEPTIERAVRDADVPDVNKSPTQQDVSTATPDMRESSAGPDTPSLPGRSLLARTTKQSISDYSPSKHDTSSVAESEPFRADPQASPAVRQARFQNHQRRDTSLTQASQDSSSVQSTLGELLDFMSKMHLRLRAIDVPTLHRRLKKHNLPGDVGHLSRTTISSIQGEIGDMRHRFRDLLSQNTVSRRELSLLFKLLKDVFSDLVELQSVVNDVTINPKLAKKLQHDAFSDGEGDTMPRGGGLGWIAAPLTSLFVAPAPRAEVPPAPPSPTRGDRSRLAPLAPSIRAAPKLQAQTSATTTHISIEFEGSGKGQVRRATPADPKKIGNVAVATTPADDYEDSTPSTPGIESSSAPGRHSASGSASLGHSSALSPTQETAAVPPLPSLPAGSKPVRSRASRSDLLGIFAGAQPAKPTTSAVARSRPRHASGQYFPVALGPAPARGMRSATEPTSNAAHSGLHGRRGPGNGPAARAYDGQRERLSTVVDAVIDDRDEDDDIAPLLERQLRPRGLSDSSIRSTVIVPEPYQAPSSRLSTVGAAAGGVLGSLSRMWRGEEATLSAPAAAEPGPSPSKPNARASSSRVANSKASPAKSSPKASPKASSKLLPTTSPKASPKAASKPLPKASPAKRRPDANVPDQYKPPPSPPPTVAPLTVPSAAPPATAAVGVVVCASTGTSPVAAGVLESLATSPTPPKRKTRVRSPDASDAGARAAARAGTKPGAEAGPKAGAKAIAARRAKSKDRGNGDADFVGADKKHAWVWAGHAHAVTSKMNELQTKKKRAASR